MRNSLTSFVAELILIGRKKQPNKGAIMSKQKLKMYIWDDVLVDFDIGKVCVLAYNIKQARDLIFNKSSTFEEKDFKQIKPIIIKAAGFLGVFREINYHSILD
jgi:hypothetical protein